MLPTKVLQKIETALLNWIGSQRFLTAQFDITNLCNLRCLHCYHPHHRNEGAIDLKSWLLILDEYQKLLSKLSLKPSVILCGGEPLLSTYFSPIVKTLSRWWPSCRLAILTNGILLTQGRVMKLKQELELVKPTFQVSLDGPDVFRHDEIRGPGNFVRALSGIKNLLTSGFRVEILAVLSEKSAPWIQEFFKLADHLKVHCMSFTRFIPQGVGEKRLQSGGDRPLSPMELKGALTSILQGSKESGIETHSDSPLYSLIDPKIGGHGKMGFQGIVIDYKGNLKVSSRTDYILGNVLQFGLENLFLRHPLLQSLRQGEIKGCGECDFYPRCGGNRNAAYAQFGSFLAPDPGCWIWEEKKECTV